ncbi:hypothetical protein [Natrinema gelatinilyticum]|uniref:hypothetical protein n=1 Tax=Natrinema gelatinilyticum TaxID=2961571 RepID=UPI0020C274AE|nr:hypothetical protein [Natrinema gelatinilyticum]
MTDENDTDTDEFEHEWMVGNGHAVGNPGGSPPAKNQNAATHHLHADPDNVLPYLKENEPEAFEWVKNKYDSYLEDAPFEHCSGKADKLLETVVCEFSIWKARGIQIRDGIVTKTHKRGADGELYQVEDEQPHNQAVNRMDRQVMSKLEKLGIFDDQSDDSPNGPLSNEYYTVVTKDSSDESDENDDDDDESGGWKVVK